ncbi:MAG: TatD family hydrolase [Magnetococcales bacterium]|nr:TatD family hydrolase [Magnetococcales bacterium]
MIDTHCHLDHHAFDSDREAVLQRSRAAGIHEWVIPAITLASFANMLRLHSTTIHIAWGLHPLFCAQHPANALDQVQAWLSHHRPVAMGEIGLDGFAPRDSQERQTELFAAQLAMAQSLRLPLLLHVRKCHEEVLGMLRKNRFAWGGVVHAFSGSAQQAERYLQMGFCLGIGGVVTRTTATRLRHLVSRLAAAAFVLESDAPDLPPAACNGQRNEPAFMVHTVDAIAALQQRPPEEIIHDCTRNARRILSLTASHPPSGEP